jgi:hypothetical protein
MLRTQTRHNSTDGRLLPHQKRFQTGHRIHVQMEAICDVKRMGRSAPNRLSKRGTAIARHDLDAGMLTEPSSDRFHLAVG